MAKNNAAQKKQQSALDRAIEKAGGIADLAKLLGTSRQLVSYWQAKARVPAERVLDIERLTGIGRTELRPDIYPST